jgi:hypothetical protein
MTKPPSSFGGAGLLAARGAALPGARGRRLARRAEGRRGRDRGADAAHLVVQGDDRRLRREAVGVAFPVRPAVGLDDVEELGLQLVGVTEAGDAFAAPTALQDTFEALRQAFRDVRRQRGALGRERPPDQEGV